MCTVCTVCTVCTTYVYSMYFAVGLIPVKKYKMAVMTFMTQKRLSTASEEILNNEAIYRNITSLTRSDWKERAVG